MVMYIKYTIFAVYWNYNETGGRQESWREYRVQVKEIPGYNILDGFQE
jgi:hypothetical protein